MQLNNASVSPDHVKGWILDIYPVAQGKMAVWIITENGERTRLVDEFKPKIYVAGTMEDIEKLASRLYANKAIASWDFVYKYAEATDTEKSKVLEIELNDCRGTSFLSRWILELGRYLRYRIYNSDLHSDQAYIYDRNIFPLALVEVETGKTRLRYTLHDSAESVDYQIPSLRIMQVHVVITKSGKIANFNDPIGRIVVTQADHNQVIDAGDEGEKLLQFVHCVKELDPDILLTTGGDAYLFPYLARRAMLNGVLSQLVLGRDYVPLVVKNEHGRTFFSYGRVYYRAPMRRLFGRIHVDESNTFILNECGFEGLIEIARTCRVPLHRAARSSIGSSMSSLQFYQALKDDVLIPRNKSIPEAFKSACELLVGDRGGFVYEPKVGIHDWVGEVDFTSMYPSLMANNNISAETVLCKCCTNSQLRIPELNYHICEKREGIVPKTLKLLISKRLLYKRLKAEAKNPYLQQVYDNRQGALKWILVTCFGYMGYKNAKFGTIDGHIGVCAFGRNAFLKASRMAEDRGFTIVHGIVDSLWLKKEGATTQEYLDLCREISEEIEVPLNYGGRYKWIIFLPSKIHPNVGVLNRYYGVMENGKIKVRGTEVRRRDTPKFVYDAQMKMIEVLAKADNSREFVTMIPDALNIVKQYRRQLLSGEVTIWDMVITKHLSKHPKDYKQRVSQLIAAQQLMKEGLKVDAGQSVRFVFTSAENRRHERRVKAKELIEKNTNPDVRKYLLLLYEAAANVLRPFGYSAENIYEVIRGFHRAQLN